MYTPPTYETDLADLARFGSNAKCGWKNIANPVPCTLPARDAGWYCPAHRAMVNGQVNPLGFVTTDGTIVPCDTDFDAPVVVTPDPRPARGTSNGTADTDPVAAARKAEALAYIRDYTGRWDFILNLRADRAWGTKWFRMTDRMVEVVLASKAREAGWAAERAAKAAAQDRPGTAQTAEVTEGWYILGETVYKVQKAVHGSGRLYAKRLDVVAGTRGEWVYEPGAMRRLGDARALTVEEAQAFGRLYGVCMVCGAVLTDEDSIENGIGPVCIRRLRGAA